MLIHLQAPPPPTLNRLDCFRSEMEQTKVTVIKLRSIWKQEKHKYRSKESEKRKQNGMDRWADIENEWKYKMGLAFSFALTCNDKTDGELFAQDTIYINE